MSGRLLRSTVGLFGLSLTTCAEGPYPDLGPASATDVPQDEGLATAVLGTWIAARADDTVMVALTGSSEQLWFTWVEFARDASVRLERGLASVKEDELTFQPKTAFELRREADTEFQDRVGAREVSPGESWSMRLVRCGGGFEDPDSELVLLPFDAVVHGAWKGSRTPNHAVELANLLLLSAKTRVIGYGQPDMFRDYVITESFPAYLDGHTAVSIRFPPTTRLGFASHQDFHGVSLVGSLDFRSPFTGNGALGGRVTFVVEEGGAATGLQARLDLTGVALEDGYPSGGEVAVEIDGTKSDVDYTALTAVDLSVLLTDVASELGCDESGEG